MDFPNPVSGDSAEASWMNKLLRACIASRLISGLGYKLRLTATGTALEIIPGTGAAAPAQGTSRFIITALAGSSGGAQFFYAKAYDGTSVSGSDVLIAKYLHQRNNMISEVIDGVTLTYQHLDDNNRIANDGTNSENDVVFPRYKIGDEIWADQPTRGTGVRYANSDLTWMEAKPARVWAKRYVT